MAREAEAAAKRKAKLEVKLAEDRLRQISLEAREAVNRAKYDYEKR